MAFQKEEAPPAGTFIGWGDRKGQYVEGKILDYAEAGGTDFKKEPCPLLEIELSRPASSFNKEGERTIYDPGTEVMVTCGTANLKKYIKKVARNGIQAGNLIRIELAGFEKVPNGTVKLFEIQIDRSVSAPASGDDHDSSSGGGSDDDEPPF